MDQQSDAMICNTRANNVYKHALENDALFLQRMNNSMPTRLRDFDREFDMMSASMNPRKYTCTDSIMSRGANVTTCNKQTFGVGWDAYTPYHLNDYLLVPCKDNTWVNHIECDDDKCCSVKHQMYMNHTRRI